MAHLGPFTHNVCLFILFFSPPHPKKVLFFFFYPDMCSSTDIADTDNIFLLLIATVVALMIDPCGGQRSRLGRIQCLGRTVP